MKTSPIPNSGHATPFPTPVLCRDDLNSPARLDRNDEPLTPEAMQPLSRLAQFAISRCRHAFQGPATVRKFLSMLLAGLVLSAESKGQSSYPFVFAPTGDYGKAYLRYVDSAATGSLTVPAEITLYDWWYERFLTAVVTDIDDYAFSGCVGVTGVTIPDGISIGDSVFRNCTSLSNVELPNDLTTIPYETFYRCSALETISIPPSVTVIGQAAFHHCAGLREVVIPSNSTLVSIGWYAFGGCTSLGEIVIPDSVTSIGSGAFEGCTSLTKAFVGKGVTSVTGFAYCTGLTEVALPNGLTTIGSGAFYGCASLDTIEIPADVTTIERVAFQGCTSLEDVIIPSKVTMIGQRAFRDCTNLGSCLFMGDAPTDFAVDAFANIPDFTIYYLTGSKGFTSPTWNGYPCLPLDLSPPDSKRIGSVTKIKGQVTVKRNGRTLVLSQHAPVFEGDMVETELQSFVRISYFEDSHINIGPRSRLTMGELIRSQAMIEASLLKGFIRVNKSPKSESLRIKTSIAAIGVRNTTLTVEVGEENGNLTTTCEVLVGVVDFEDLVGGGTEELRTGQSVSNQSAVATHTLTLGNPSAGQGGLMLNGVAITGFPHVGTYPQGTKLTLQAIPTAGSVFSSWTGDIVSTNPSYTFYLDEDMNVAANFLTGTNFATRHPGLDRDGDANHNGRSNFLDYAGGMDPEAPSTFPIMAATPNALTLRQRINGLDARPLAQYSDDLGKWFPLEEGTHYTVLSSTVDGQMLTQEIELSQPSPPARFFRQKFESSLAEE